ncbi:hypothetical protein IAI10_14225 [Clostridium sp. 19966]|uniref:hypothetical protein n=1 Tax=Clostridium sp. 19966 TaxID=2768166 RepID=UPI0028DE56DB|nr:hypothetical protein [Clostridium sp. 19966]MDT8717821.1 hypothetical protein [Clostridium sp. 19966]
MIYGILNRLEQDETLQTLLNASAEDNKIYPMNADKDKVPCLAFKDNPVSDDGRIKVNRLELRIFDTDYERLEKIARRIGEILIIQEGDEGFIFQDMSIMSCSQDGGGNTEDLANKIYQKYYYFNITWRYL